MPFELARFGLPNIAAIVALALLPLIALPMHRHQTAAKAQPIPAQQVEHVASAAINVAYDIAD